MCMKESINERINALYEYSLERSIRAYAMKVGLAPTTLNECLRNGAEPRYTLIKRIIDSTPGLSIKWLLTGEGEMFESEERAPSKSGHDPEELQKLKERVKYLEGSNDALRELLFRKADRTENEELRKKHVG